MLFSEDPRFLLQLLEAGDPAAADLPAQYELLSKLNGHYKVARSETAKELATGEITFRGEKRKVSKEQREFISGVSGSLGLSHSEVAGLVLCHGIEAEGGEETSKGKGGISKKSDNSNSTAYGDVLRAELVDLYHCHRVVWLECVVAVLTVSGGEDSEYDKAAKALWEKDLWKNLLERITNPRGVIRQTSASTFSSSGGSKVPASAEQLLREVSCYADMILAAGLCAPSRAPGGIGVCPEDIASMVEAVAAANWGSEPLAHHSTSPAAESLTRKAQIGTAVAFLSHLPLDQLLEDTLDIHNINILSRGLKPLLDIHVALERRVGHEEDTGVRSVGTGIALLGWTVFISRISPLISTMDPEDLPGTVSQVDKNTFLSIGVAAVTNAAMVREPFAALVETKDLPGSLSVAYRSVARLCALSVVTAFSIRTMADPREYVSCLAKLHDGSATHATQFWSEDVHIPNVAAVLEVSGLCAPFRPGSILELLSSLSSTADSAMHAYEYLSNLATYCHRIGVPGTSSQRTLEAAPKIQGTFDIFSPEEQIPRVGRLPIVIPLNTIGRLLAVPVSAADRAVKASESRKYLRSPYISVEGSRVGSKTHEEAASDVTDTAVWAHPHNGCAWLVGSLIALSKKLQAGTAGSTGAELAEDVDNAVAGLSFISAVCSHHSEAAVELSRLTLGISEGIPPSELENSPRTATPLAHLTAALVQGAAHFGGTHREKPLVELATKALDVLCAIAKRFPVCVISAMTSAGMLSNESGARSSLNHLHRTTGQLSATYPTTHAFLKLSRRLLVAVRSVEVADALEVSSGPGQEEYSGMAVPVTPHVGGKLQNTWNFTPAACATPGARSAKRRAESMERLNKTLLQNTPAHLSTRAGYPSFVGADFTMNGGGGVSGSGPSGDAAALQSAPAVNIREATLDSLVQFAAVDVFSKVSHNSYAHLSERWQLAEEVLDVLEAAIAPIPSGVGFSEAACSARRLALSLLQESRPVGTALVSLACTGTATMTAYYLTKGAVASRDLVSCVARAMDVCVTVLSRGSGATAGCFAPLLSQLLDDNPGKNSVPHIMVLLLSYLSYQYSPQIPEAAMRLLESLCKHSAAQDCTDDVAAPLGAASIPKRVPVTNLVLYLGSDAPRLERVLSRCLADSFSLPGLQGAVFGVVHSVIGHQPGLARALLRTESESPLAKGAILHTALQLVRDFPKAVESLTEALKKSSFSATGGSESPEELLSLQFNRVAISQVEEKASSWCLDSSGTSEVEQTEVRDQARDDALVPVLLGVHAFLALEQLWSNPCKFAETVSAVRKCAGFWSDFSKVLKIPISPVAPGVVRAALSRAHAAVWNVLKSELYYTNADATFDPNFLATVKGLGAWGVFTEPKGGSAASPPPNSPPKTPSRGVSSAAAAAKGFVSPVLGSSPLMYGALPYEPAVTRALHSRWAQTGIELEAFSVQEIGPTSKTKGLHIPGTAGGLFASSHTAYGSSFYYNCDALKSACEVSSGAVDKEFTALLSKTAELNMSLSAADAHYAALKSWGEFTAICTIQVRDALLLPSATAALPESGSKVALGVLATALTGNSAERAPTKPTQGAVASAISSSSFSAVVSGTVSAVLAAVELKTPGMPASHLPMGSPSSAVTAAAETTASEAATPECGDHVVSCHTTTLLEVVHFLLQLMSSALTFSGLRMVPPSRNTTPGASTASSPRNRRMAGQLPPALGAVSALAMDGDGGVLEVILQILENLNSVASECISTLGALGEVNSGNSSQRIHAILEASLRCVLVAVVALNTAPGLTSKASSLPSSVAAVSKTLETLRPLVLLFRDLPCGMETANHGASVSGILTACTVFVSAQAGITSDGVVLGGELHDCVHEFIPTTVRYLGTCIVAKRPTLTLGTLSFLLNVAGTPAGAEALVNAGLLYSLSHSELSASLHSIPMYMDDGSLAPEHAAWTAALRLLTRVMSHILPTAGGVSSTMFGDLLSSTSSTLNPGLPFVSRVESFITAHSTRLMDSLKLGNPAFPLPGTGVTVPVSAGAGTPKKAAGAQRLAVDRRMVASLLGPHAVPLTLGTLRELHVVVTFVARFSAMFSSKSTSRHADPLIHSCAVLVTRISLVLQHGRSLPFLCEPQSTLERSWTDTSARSRRPSVPSSGSGAAGRRPGRGMPPSPAVHTSILRASSVVPSPLPRTRLPGSPGSSTTEKSTCSPSGTGCVGDASNIGSSLTAEWAMSSGTRHTMELDSQSEALKGSTGVLQGLSFVDRVENMLLLALDGALVCLREASPRTLHPAAPALNDPSSVSWFFSPSVSGPPAHCSNITPDLGALLTTMNVALKHLVQGGEGATSGTGTSSLASPSAARVASLNPFVHPRNVPAAHRLSNSARFWIGVVESVVWCLISHTRLFVASQNTMSSLTPKERNDVREEVPRELDAFLKRYVSVLKQQCQQSMNAPEDQDALSFAEWANAFIGSQALFQSSIDALTV